MSGFPETTTMTITPRVTRGHYEVGCYLNSSLIGYATFKPGLNRYTRGHRLASWTVFSGYQRLGVGHALIDHFVNSTGRTVFPSQLFGASGKLTRAGLDAMVAYLSTHAMAWLPTDWRELIEEPLL